MTLQHCAATLLALTIGLNHGAAGPDSIPQEKSSQADAKLPMSGLMPAKIQPGLCLVKYRITTKSPECQAFFDQGLGYFYSYVWMEAARSFETACRHDPDCALAWWGLSRSLESYRRSHVDALKKAQVLMPKASHREQLLIQARLEEKGLWPNVGTGEARLKAAIKTIDTMLSLYDDDEEGWYARGQLSSGGGFFGGTVSSAPFFKALLKINPLHPGANHELVHFYETSKRPALGWIYSEKYIESTPGIPHSYHMQAHLATRIGRWDKTTDRSQKAIELERAYHKEMNVKPSQDSQYAHHLEIFMRCLIHDGRFAEARQTKKECQADNIKHTQQWFRLHLTERDYDSAMEIAESERKRDKNSGAYLAALVHLKKNDAEKAAPEVAFLADAQQQKKKNDKQLQLRLWEVQGILLCQQGQPDEGLPLLVKAVERTKNEYSKHAWGDGAYHMQAWGLAALTSHRFGAAEEAFLEALAHDAGCFQAALGLQVLCEKLDRAEEASRYANLAKRFWRKAAPEDVARELELLRASVASGEQETRRGGEGETRRQEVRENGNLQFAVCNSQFAICDLQSEICDPLELQAKQPASGLLPGERPGPYSSLIVTGPNRGAPHCFICETADKPAVLIFAREASEPLGKLVGMLDKALETHKDADLKAWVTFLHTDQSAIDAKLLDWSRKHAIASVPIGVFEDVGGPPAYRLAPQVEVTVLMFVKQQVVSNFSFRAGELNDDRVGEILKEMPGLVAK